MWVTVSRLCDVRFCMSRPTQSTFVDVHCNYNNNNNNNNNNNTNNNSNNNCNEKRTQRDVNTARWL